MSRSLVVSRSSAVLCARRRRAGWCSWRGGWVWRLRPWRRARPGGGPERPRGRRPRTSALRLSLRSDTLVIGAMKVRVVMLVRVKLEVREGQSRD
jgi:hypothetical protein